LAEGKNQVVFGKYNADNKEASFIIGNGVHDKERSNLIEVTKNKIQIGEFTVENGVAKVGDRQLTAIDEDGNIGVEAIKLTSPSQMAINLSSTGTTSFDGSGGNVEIPIKATSILPLANGGTGKSFADEQAFKKYYGINNISNEAKFLKPHSYAINGIDVSNGYIKFATIEILSNTNPIFNEPIEFIINKKNINSPLRAIVKFKINGSITSYLENNPSSYITNDLDLYVYGDSNIDPFSILETKVIVVKRYSGNKFSYDLGLYSE